MLGNCGATAPRRRPPDLTAEALAVSVLAGELAGEDLELSIDSETNFRECVSAVLAGIDEAEGMVEAIEARKKALDCRAARFQAKAARMREALIGAMATAGLKTLPLPEATVTVSEAAPGVIVTDETALPAECLTTKTTTRPDLRLITSRLRNGVETPGATLRNAAPKLVVRQS